MNYENGMKVSSFLKSQPRAKPIGIGDFAKALERPWRYSLSSIGSSTRTLGLAISGGVDSMALAVLCSRLQSAPVPFSEEVETAGNFKSHVFRHLPIIDFKAFVVDHGVRIGSGEEAKWVAAILNSKGISTRVLKIDWHDLTDPVSRPNFETLARTRRWQLLGKACKSRDIRSLLLAHHQDDQVETILMRMSKGQKNSGLAGIKAEGGIPECYGIHGLHESGHFDLPQTSKSDEPGDLEPSEPPQILSESGGIRVYRPLLDFDKDRLIATCQAHGMKWFEDPTNKDPSLTTRNTIRHIYKTHKLPVALSKPFLLKLSERCRQNVAARHELAESLLSKCEVSNFDKRFGTLQVRFPRLENISSREAAEVIRRIMILVTPEEHVPTPSLSTMIQRIFPDSQNQAPRQPKSFTVAGVLFQPLLADSEHEEYSPYDKSTPPKWLLSRQLHYNSKLKPAITFPPRNPRSPAWSNWQLWDGRYWFRVQNNHPLPVTVRTFGQGDMRSFSNDKSTSGLKSQFRRFAPGKIRYTLPCLVIPKETISKGLGDTVVALPTLDISNKYLQDHVKWEVRYKKVYWDGLPDPVST
ncbi:PP-loop family-domain-containing protein [Amylocarpus encephaloides]|uniref:tRNA(Ile)-lysidine synthetase n=1 Tax=Amylocarpus encephaloides TaxID=45428 RepID=A0A9P8BZH5_9HELO|nr:PP-loop family-domain-containing protein [Amylocarpus encephaloides]